MGDAAGYRIAERIDMRDHWDGITAMYAGAANVALQMLGARGVAQGVL